MLRLFARGPKGKGAGNPHETKEQAHQASLLSISVRRSLAHEIAARVFGSDLAPPPGLSEGRRRKLQLGSHG
jgi:hypothetical protein